MSSVYLVEQRKNKELNLEHIDEEMRMEQVRQLAEKMDWATFGQSVRKNLLEKRNTIDADGRIDVLKGLAFMRTKMPIEQNAPIEEKFRIMADSLGGTYTKSPRGWSVVKQGEVMMDFTVTDDKVTTLLLSFWDGEMFYSPLATNLLLNEQWTELRDCIASILTKYDKDLSKEDKTNCKNAMYMLEKFFSRHSTDNTFTVIQESNYGFYLRPHDLRQGRLYYTVDPIFRNLRTKDLIFSLFDEDYENLPYIEFGFVKNDVPCTLPELNEGDEWNETVEAQAAICLKLSKGIIISESTRKKLAKFSAKAPTVRHYTNCYRYVSGDTQIEKDLQMITQFTDGNAQQLYVIDAYSFDNEGDSVITEVYLKRVQDFHKVIAILRNEAMHMSLWESMLASCYEKQGFTKQKIDAIKMNVSLTRKQISILFVTKYAPIRVLIQDSKALEAKVEVINGFTGLPISERINEVLSRKLNETWSIPIMLTHFVSGDDCHLEQVTVPLRTENPETIALTPPHHRFVSRSK